MGRREGQWSVTGLCILVKLRMQGRELQRYRFFQDIHLCQEEQHCCLCEIFGWQYFCYCRDYLWTLLLDTNEKTFSGAKSIQNKKISNLVLENSNLISETSHNPEKLIFNFSSLKLNDDEKLLLCKSLKFSIPPEHLD